MRFTPAFCEAFLIFFQVLRNTHQEYQNKLTLLTLFWKQLPENSALLKASKVTVKAFLLSEVMYYREKRKSNVQKSNIGYTLAQNTGNNSLRKAVLYAFCKPQEGSPTCQAMLPLTTKVVVYHVQIVPLSLAQNGVTLFSRKTSSSMTDLGPLTISLLPEECHTVLGKPTSSTSSFPIRTFPGSARDSWDASPFK